MSDNQTVPFTSLEDFVALTRKGREEIIALYKRAGVDAPDFGEAKGDELVQLQSDFLMQAQLGHGVPVEEGEDVTLLPVDPETMPTNDGEAGAGDDEGEGAESGAGDDEQNNGTAHGDDVVFQGKRVIDQAYKIVHGRTYVEITCEDGSKSLLAKEEFVDIGGTLPAEEEENEDDDE